MRYLSCFSGIGGLEASSPPVGFCDSDPDARRTLAREFPDIQIWNDIQTMEPPRVDVVAGGWPCQDLSIAGNQKGLSGLRSRLLIDMLRVAKDARATTIVAENVPNLLKLNQGMEFKASLNAIHHGGFRFIAWRVLNARAFGLPQNRNRVLMVASNDREIVETLFRPTPKLKPGTVESSKASDAAGFYWTAGTHSLNYSRGYVPTIKVGSSLSIASPPAVHYGNVVRGLSAQEALQLQGFDIPLEFFASRSAAFRAAGNAVPRPMGRWVMDGALDGTQGSSSAAVEEPLFDTKAADTATMTDPKPGTYPKIGLSENGSISGVSRMDSRSKALDLIDFLDLDDESRLSPRAASGLLKRLERSRQSCPSDLHDALCVLAAEHQAT